MQIKGNVATTGKLKASLLIGIPGLTAIVFLAGGFSPVSRLIGIFLAGISVLILSAVLAGRLSNVLGLLRASEQRYRNFFERSRDGMAISDGWGNIIAWNDAQEKLSGLKRQRVLGFPVWEALHLCFPESVQCPALQAHIKSKILALLNQPNQKPGDWPGRTMEQAIRSPSGSLMGVQAMMFAFEAEGGTLIGLICRGVGTPGCEACAANQFS